MSDLPRWSSRFMCFLCRARATVRIFSGTYGGGYPTCKEHEGEAAKQALEPLATNTIADDYRVIAHEVLVDEYGHPKMGRVLWRATKKEGRHEVT